MNLLHVLKMIYKQLKTVDNGNSINLVFDIIFKGVIFINLSQKKTCEVNGNREYIHEYH